MSCLAPFTSFFQFTKRISQDTVNRESESHRQSPHTTSIQILDDDSLLNIFYLYRPLLLGEQDRDVNTRFKGGAQWAGERWWYRLAHVCRRWRNLILGSASYLSLCLVCTYGTPVADMLAHSPPLPLVIDYFGHDITAEEEEAIILTLEQRDRIRRIRLFIPVLNLQKLIMAINGEYPILEYLILWDLSVDKCTVLILPETLQAPRLRLLTIDCSIPIRPGMAVGLVTLHVALYNPLTYFHPTALLQWLSLMSQLEILLIFFYFPAPNRDVETQPMHTPIIPHFTLPNLRVFALGADTAFTEAVLSRITASRLEGFQVWHPNELTFSVPQLAQFIGRIETFRLDRAKFCFFANRIYVGANPVNPRETNMPEDTFSMTITCWQLEFQVYSLSQIINTLTQLFSTVEHLTLSHDVYRWSSEERNVVDRTQWRELLRSFSNLKTLHIGDGLVMELSHCLRLDDGEHALELFPELQELTYPGGSNADDGFTSFIDARQNAGRPVNLIKS